MAGETSVDRGQWAEELAAEYLRSQGYSIVAHNHRTQHGEVDLVAWDAGVLCFVEVRARENEDFGDPLESITQAKIRRIVLAAKDYLEEVE